MKQSDYIPLILLIAICLMVINLPPEPEIVKVVPNKTINRTITSEQVVGFVSTLGDKVSPSKPWLGWIIIIVVIGFAVIPFFDFMRDKVYYWFRYKGWQKH